MRSLELDGEADGDSEADGLSEGVSDSDLLAELEGVSDAEALDELELDGLSEAEGDSEADSEVEAEGEAERLGELPEAAVKVAPGVNGRQIAVNIIEPLVTLAVPTVKTMSSPVITTGKLVAVSAAKAAGEASHILLALIDVAVVVVMIPVVSVAVPRAKVPPVPTGVEVASA